MHIIFYNIVVRTVSLPQHGFLVGLTADCSESSVKKC